MLERILVPLDGSVTAEGILPHVRRLLRRHDSELVLLRVANPPPLEEQVPILEASLSAAREYIAGVRDRLEQQGVRVKALARVGPAAGTILDVAEDEKVSLIALATHGRTGLKRALFGSVAEHVMRKSPVPVLAVRPFWSYEILPPGRTEDRSLQGILVPTDGSDLSMAVLPPAVEMAKLFGARLVLLHVQDPESEVAQERLEELAKRAKGVETATVRDRGEPAKAILDNARFHGCDLIAMTTHGRSGLSRLAVGSVTEKVLREATLPLLIVRSREKAKKAVAKAAGKGKR